MTSTSDPKREQLAISAYRDAVIRLDEIEHDKALMYIFEIGRIYERQKNYTDALQQYSRIIYRILDNPELYTQTGIQIGIKAYINFEKIEKSAGNYERVNLLYNRIREADVPNFNP
jgi:tetratricopeptide (TPR) repeat protein